MQMVKAASELKCGLREHKRVRWRRCYRHHHPIQSLGQQHNLLDFSFDRGKSSAEIALATAYGSSATNDFTTAIAPTVRTVASISPSSGPPAGGTPVAITGTGFVSGVAVTIGGAATTSVTFVNSTSITAITPAGTAGPQDVVVTNPDTQIGTLTGGFTYGAVVDSATYEVNGVILGGVTLILDGTTQVTSAADGTYQLDVTTTGSHTIVATETGYRSQTQTINVTDLNATDPLDFKGDMVWYRMPQVFHLCWPASTNGNTRLLMALDWISPRY